jgi:hypothetical protein
MLLRFEVGSLPQCSAMVGAALHKIRIRDMNPFAVIPEVASDLDKG